MLLMLISLSTRVTIEQKNTSMPPYCVASQHHLIHSPRRSIKQKALTIENTTMDQPRSMKIHQPNAPQDFPGVIVGEIRTVLHSGKDHVTRGRGEFTRERELFVLAKRQQGAKRHKAGSRLARGVDTISPYRNNISPSL